MFTYEVLIGYREKFERLYDRREPNECWPWTGYAPSYGQFSTFKMGRPTGAHVAAWAYANGRLPRKNKLVMHSCDNRICVNPAHLSEGTKRDNIVDCVTKNRFTSPMTRPEVVAKVRGENSLRAKLTEAQVVEMIEKLAKGAYSRDLAAEYGVAYSTVLGIRCGDTWKHLPRPPFPKLTNLGRPQPSRRCPPDL